MKADPEVLWLIVGFRESVEQGFVVLLSAFYFLAYFSAK